MEEWKVERKGDRKEGKEGRRQEERKVSHSANEYAI